MNSQPVTKDVGQPPARSRPMNVLDQREKAVIGVDGKATIKTFVRVPSNNYGTAIFLAFFYIFAVVIASHGGALSFITTFMGLGILIMIYMLYTSTKWVEVE